VAEIAQISGDELQVIAGREGFDFTQLMQDYYVTAIVFLLKDIEGIHFKGGTALQKIFLNHTRLSEDADYTVSTDIDKLRKPIEKRIKESRLFQEVTKDKDVKGYLRLVAHYRDPFGDKGTVFIDLNSRASLVLKPERNNVSHFYEGYIPAFSVSTLALKELIAEKVAAAIARNQPRDHFDIYQIIRHDLPIDMKLVEKKCRSSGDEFNIIRMFDKAKTLKNRWDKDLLPLVREEVPFETVMKTLAKRFDLAGEKKRLRNLNAKMAQVH